MSSDAPGPKATMIGHAAVGLAGSAAVHAIVRPKTTLEALFAWLLGAAAMILAHAVFDLPVARLLTAIAAG